MARKLLDYAGLGRLIAGLKGEYSASAGLDNYITVDVDGDADTYYPVMISQKSAGLFPSMLLSVSRDYAAKAPSSWNNATHKGALTLCILWNNSKFWDGNGAGSRTVTHIIELYQQYSTTLGGIATSTRGLMVWLRGGGARYWIHSGGGTGLSATVHLEPYTDSANQVFAPRTEPVGVSDYQTLNVHANSANTATRASYADALRDPDYHDTAHRRASANVNFNNDAGLHKFLATSTMVTGRPMADGHILHCEWDNSLSWAAQLFLPTNGGSMQWRNQGDAEWQPWRTLLDTTNYAQLLDGEVPVRRLLFNKSDYQEYVVLLCPTAVDSQHRHRLSGKIYTEAYGSSRYQACDIDLWFSAWPGTSDSVFRIDNYGQRTGWKLVTCTHDGETWYAIRHVNAQAVYAYFIGTSENIDFTPIHYCTNKGGTVTVVDQEVYGSIVDRSAELTTVNAKVSNAANADRLGNIASGNYMTLHTSQVVSSTKRFTVPQYFANLIGDHVDTGGHALTWYHDVAGKHVLGIGAVTYDGKAGGAFLGWGDAPWERANSLNVSADAFTYKGFDVLHDGNYTTKLDGRYLCRTGGPMTNTDVVVNLNADMLDGYHASWFVRRDSLTLQHLDDINGWGFMTQAMSANAMDELGYPIGEAGLLIYGQAAYSSSAQIYGSFSTNRWFARGGGSGVSAKTAWREFAMVDYVEANYIKSVGDGTLVGDLTVMGDVTAFGAGHAFVGDLSGNAATATKLQTARKIGVRDYTLAHAGTVVSVDGSSDVLLPLPSVMDMLTVNVDTALWLNGGAMLRGRGSYGGFNLYAGYSAVQNEILRIDGENRDGTFACNILKADLSGNLAVGPVNVDPAYRLLVSGNSKIDGTLYVGDIPIEYDDAEEQIIIRGNVRITGELIY